MGKLFIYEGKKLFSRRLIPALILFLFLFNGLMVYRESRTRVGWYYKKTDVGRVYDDLSSMTAPEAEAWLSERLDYLKAVAVWREWADNAEAWNEEDRAAFKKQNREILSRYPDLDIEESSLRYLRSFYNEQHLLAEILEQVSAVAHYEDYLNRIGEEAKIMTSSSLFGKPGTFSYRNIEKTPPVYEHLKGTVLPAEDSEGMLLATGSRITDLLLLCLFVVLGLSMLIGEREDGTLLLIKPMKRGYLDTIAAKLALMLCLAAAGTVLFYGTDFLIAEKTLGLGDLSRPVQSLRGFLTSPYAMTSGQYLAGFLLAKVGAALVYGALIFCLGTVFKNALSACLAMGGVLALEFLLYLTIGIHSWLSPLKILNLVCLADTGWFFADYLNMNIAGYPVNIVPVCMGTALLVFGLSVFFALRRFVTETSALSRESRLLALFKRRGKKRRRRKLRIRVGLFGKEGFKIFFMEHAWILLVLFALIQWNSYRDFRIYTDADENFYRYYVTKAEGKTLPETAVLYQEEYDRFEGLAKEMEQQTKDYAAGKLSYMDYQDAAALYQAKTRGQIGFERAAGQYEYVLSMTREGDRAELFYDSGWDALFNQMGRREDVMNAGKLCFFLVLGLAAVFSVEKSSGMIQLQHAYLRGRSGVCAGKFLSGAIYGTAAYVIAYLPRYLTVFHAYGRSGLTAPLRSFSELSAVPFNVPLWAYLALVGLSRYLGMLAAAGLILWLSARTGNMIHTILISLLILLLPVFLYLMGLMGEPAFSFLPMMTGADMYRITAGRLLYWGAALGIGLWFYFQTYEEGSVS